VNVLGIIAFGRNNCEVTVFYATAALRTAHGQHLVKESTVPDLEYCNLSPSGGVLTSGC
jgi:hypothetical protein